MDSSFLSWAKPTKGPPEAAFKLVFTCRLCKVDFKRKWSGVVVVCLNCKHTWSRPVLQTTRAPSFRHLSLQKSCHRSHGCVCVCVCVCGVGSLPYKTWWTAKRLSTLTNWTRQINLKLALLSSIMRTLLTWIKSYTERFHCYANLSSYRDQVIGNQFKLGALRTAAEVIQRFVCRQCGCYCFIFTLETSSTSVIFTWWWRKNIGVSMNWV